MALLHNWPIQNKTIVEQSDVSIPSRPEYE